MGFLTRSVNFSSGHTLSSGAAGSAVLDIGEYVAFGIMVHSTGAISSALGFNVGMANDTAQMLPLANEFNAAVTLPLSTTTKQAYDLPAALAAWRYVQITSTAGSTGISFSFIRKG